MKQKINTKSKRILFSLIGISLISLPIFTLASCKNKNNDKDNNSQENKNEDDNNQTDKPDLSLNYPDSEFKKDVDNLKLSSGLEDKFQLIFRDFTSGGSKKEDIFPSQIQNNPNILQIKAKDAELNKKIRFKIQGVILEDNANVTGEAKINVVFVNKATLKEENQIFSLSGLSKSFTNTDPNGNKPNNRIANEKNPNEVILYNKWDQEKRFEKDNKDHLDGLKNYLAQSAGINNWKELRKNLEASAEDIKKFDEKAKKLGQDSFENSAFKGFTLPSHKDGKIEGLDILEDEEIGKQPSWVDSLGQKDIYKTIGLARKIVNENYLNIAKQTFSVRLNNIKDYKDEIFAIQADITFFGKVENKLKYQELNKERIDKLKRDKEKITAELDEEIKNNKDVHLEKAKRDKKEKILKEYDEKIKYYEKQTLDQYLKFLESQIEELKKKAEKKDEYTPENGTMWILDYQLSSDGYPTKWYFGTNSHVAKAITDNLVSFSLTKINDDIKVGSLLRLSQLDSNITTFGFSKQEIVKNAIKKVFDGTDFLKKNASDYLSSKSKEKYGDLGSFADFAVIEIDFDKLKDFVAFSNYRDISSEIKNKKIKLTENEAKFTKELARLITNNYADDSNKDKHIKFRQSSYLKDYKKINYPLIGELPKDIEFLYAVGWPSSRGDFYLKQYIDDDQRKVAEHGFSLWTNSEYTYYDKNVTQGEGSIVTDDELKKYARGNFLSYQIGYRSFRNMPGILDTFIASPKTGKDFYILNGKKYANMGLGYMPRRWAPIGGASGSSIRNQNNELVAVYYATNTNARVGLSVAFRSEGFDYEGLYGSEYKLPQYDLIYGGGKDQKNSYRQELEKLYKDKGITTNLFQSGLDKVPQEFEFKNINHLTASDLKKNNSN
ncbi:Ig-specific serine endopeptidase MIP [Metamycoplasma alkalescens]|uniref:Ig-specific serine endopeptidase MIP n=1 Tax=Metamycoplasma alkalescens TaxID=45363 RepID=UPI003CFBCD76